MGDITVILNSGPLKERGKLAEKLAESLRDAGCNADIVAINDSKNFPKICKTEIAKAKAKKGIIVAAGGDGTVNAIANLCYHHKVTMGIIPMGTFNYFARDLLIPTDMNNAVQTIAKGNIRRVSVGLVQGRVFLNNASFGLYTRLIREREQASSRFGRVRMIAALAAVYSLFKKHKLFTITISADGKVERHTSPMVFVGNNTLQLENLGMEVAAHTKKDKLAIVIMKACSRWEIASFVLRGVLKTLKDESRLTEMGAENFEVTTRRKTIDLVLDGEIIRCDTPLNFKIEKNALTVLAPLPDDMPL